MSWLRGSDHSHEHPVVFQALEHPEADDRTLNELYGCIHRCATYVAAFEGDYVIRMGSFKALAGMSRWKVLEDQAVMAGYCTRVQLEDGSPALKLIEDQELFHMIPRSAREWANQRKADTRNKSLVVPVRVRDGDGCRYCGEVVIWGDQKGGRGGTYDHLKPGEAGTTETFVVACRSCNSSRQDDRPGFDKEHPLLPEPAKPYYSRSTTAWLAKNAVHVEPTDGSRTTTPTDEQPSGQAYGTTTASRPDSDPRMGEHTAPATPTVPEPATSKAAQQGAEDGPGGGAANSGESRPIERVTDPGMSGRVGAGRAGPGREGSGQAGTGLDGSGTGGAGRRIPEADETPPGPGEKSVQAKGKRRRKRKR